jgi:GNAT superfamily N-acetyltransferase
MVARQPGLRIEQLNTSHQRGAFDCGEPPLNQFLSEQAGQLARKNVCKTYVTVSGDSSDVLGFVSVAVGQVQTTQLPTHLKLPRYPVPLFRIARLGVDLGQQGQGIGQHLMAFALQMALDFSQQAGLYAVLVDAKHAKAAKFYADLGFLETVDDPLCMYLPIGTLQKLRQKP